MPAEPSQFTIELDPDVERMIHSRMEARGISFDQAVNDAVREASARPERPFATETASMGVSAVSLDRALPLAAALEDDADFALFPVRWERPPT